MSRCGSFCFGFLNASLVLPPFLSRKHSSKKGKIGGQGRETGSHKGQMWSDGCCSSGRCARKQLKQSVALLTALSFH